MKGHFHTWALSILKKVPWKVWLQTFVMNFTKKLRFYVLGCSVEITEIYSHTFLQEIREHNDITHELTKQLIWRNIFPLAVIFSKAAALWNFTFTKNSVKSIFLFYHVLNHFHGKIPIFNNFNLEKSLTKIFSRQINSIVIHLVMYFHEIFAKKAWE